MDKQWVIFYGTSRWSSYFFISDDVKVAVTDWLEYCQKRVPNEVMSNPEIFEKVLWVKVYFLESEIYG